MRLSIGLFGRKDSIPRNDDISNNDKMNCEEKESQTIINDTTNPIPNNNNNNNNNENSNNDNNNDTNSSENNNNKNTLTTKLGILSRFLPPAMTHFRNQGASNSPRSHVSRCRRGNSNAAAATTTTNNDNNNRNNANINNNKNNNSNGISTRFINSSSSSTNSNCGNNTSTDASSRTNTNNNNTPEPRLLDINCNITTFKRHRDSLEDSSDLDNTTTDNDAVTKRSSPRSSMSWRSSIPRSDSIPSVEDSGFSSSNGLSDDRDDVSINNASFDCICEDSQCPHRVNNNKRDSVNSTQHPFILCSVSARRRARTYSLDSTSSDLSDTNASSSSTISKTKSFSSSSTPSSRSSSSSHEKHSSKLSSSLPTSCVHSSDNSDDDRSSDNNNKERRRKSPSISEQSKLSTTVVVKRRSFRNKSRRNASSSSSKSNSSNIGTPVIDTPSPAASVHSLVITDSHVQSEARRRSHDGVIGSNSDHNNNINSDSDIFADTSSRKKDLSSCVEAAMPFRFADLFRPHGLVTLVACILYTLLLMFLCGGLALAWTLLKKCVNKSDLKDLRSNMLESRRRREIVATPSYSTSDADDGTC